MKLADILAGVASPIAAAILRGVCLDLEPLPVWGLPAATVSPVTYIIAAGLAAVAYLWRIRPIRKRLLVLIIGVVVLAISWVAVSYFTHTPPLSDYKTAFHIAGITSFLLTYISFGFLVGRVTAFAVGH